MHSPGTESASVSRETPSIRSEGAGMSEPVAAVPPAAQEIFGSNLPLAQRYAELLSTEALERGLIGPREVPRLWGRHLLNCAAMAELIEPSADLIDVGSGAGLPGIALAIARPDLTVLLVEPLLRRSSWLTDIVTRLGLGQVSVRRARAEELHSRVDAAYVTARAVAPMDRLVSWCLPLVRPGGELLAMKGATAGEELTAAADTIRRLGGVAWEVREVGPATLTDRTSVVQVRVGSSASRAGRSGTEGAPRPSALDLVARAETVRPTKRSTKSSTNRPTKKRGGER